MLDGLKLKIGGSVLGSVLKSLATNKDTQTSITGVLAAAMLAIPGLDLSKLLAGDPLQLAHIGAGLLVALIGWWATKRQHDGDATAAGALAGVLYASTGQISDIATGAIVALLGYYTNKPTSPQ